MAGVLSGTPGDKKKTGEWQWTFQVGDLENVNITHWAVMPKARRLEHNDHIYQKELIKEIKERISSLEVRDDIERRAYEIALVSLEVEQMNAKPMNYSWKSVSVT